MDVVINYVHVDEGQDRVWWSMNRFYSGFDAFFHPELKACAHLLIIIYLYWFKSVMVAPFSFFYSILTNYVLECLTQVRISHYFTHLFSDHFPAFFLFNLSKWCKQWIPFIFTYQGSQLIHSYRLRITSFVSFILCFTPLVNVLYQPIFLFHCIFLIKPIWNPSVWHRQKMCREEMSSNEN